MLLAGSSRQVTWMGGARIRGHSHRPRPRTSAVHVRAAFEPTAPGAAQIASSLVVLSSSLITGAYWWFVIVPSERANLAKQKRQKKGAVRVYLEQLEQDPSPDRKAEKWFYTDWLNQLQRRKSLSAWGKPGSEETAPSEPSPAGDASGEQQGALNPLPVESNPTPAFFNLDNPIIFVTAALVLMATVAAITR